MGSRDLEKTLDTSDTISSEPHHITTAKVGNMAGCSGNDNMAAW